MTIEQLIAYCETASSQWEDKMEDPKEDAESATYYAGRFDECNEVLGKLKKVKGELE